MIVALTSRQWNSLVAATDLGEACASIERMMDVDLSDEGGRYTARELIGATLRPWVLSRSIAEVREIFDAHDVCWGPYQTFTGSSSRIRAARRRTRCSPTWSSRGSAPTECRARRWSSGGRAPRASRAPTLGEHTEEVLAEVLGLSDAEIGRLLGDGVVAGESLGAPGKPQRTLASERLPGKRQADRAAAGTRAPWSGSGLPIVCSVQRRGGAQVHAARLPGSSRRRCARSERRHCVVVELSGAINRRGPGKPSDGR